MSTMLEKVINKFTITVHANVFLFTYNAGYLICQYPHNFRLWRNECYMLPIPDPPGIWAWDEGSALGQSISLFEIVSKDRDLNERKNTICILHDVLWSSSVIVTVYWSNIQFEMWWKYLLARVRPRPLTVNVKFQFEDESCGIFAPFFKKNVSIFFKKLLFVFVWSSVCQQTCLSLWYKA